MSVSENLRELLKQLPEGCRLVAVSKNQSADKVLEAYEAGHRVFGENKVQEMVSKAEVLPKDIEWHLIGHLQTNKVKYISAFVSMIHSVDSLKLIEEIDKQGARVDRVLDCLLQVHVAKEETKFGLSEEEIFELVQSPKWASLKNIRILGLMGMASFTENVDQVRSEFVHVRTIFEKLRSLTLPDSFVLRELSMGMSGDYTIAIEEGSTMVRVGTAIFGSR
jgi:PLP dependent protein